MGIDQFRTLLEEAIHVRGWSLSKFARAADIQASVISRWLNVPEGATSSRPSPRNLEKLAPLIGAPHEDLMRMCGYLPSEPLARISAKRLALHADLDAWLAAVGPDYEDVFWDDLKNRGDSTVRLIQQIRTAVNPSGGTDINQPSNDRSKRGRRRRGPSDGRLTGTKYASVGHPAARYQAPLERKAA